MPTISQESFNELYEQGRAEYTKLDYATAKLIRVTPRDKARLIRLGLIKGHRTDKETIQTLLTLAETVLGLPQIDAASSTEG